MKSQFFLSLAAVAVALTSCTNNNAPEQKVETNVPNPQVVSADGNEIIYNVYLKPQDMRDADAEELYANFDRQAFVDSLFAAVYSHGVTVTDMEGNVLSIDDIKVREVEDPNYSRDKVAGIQFTEAWVYSPSSNTMTKTVKSMLVGYEVVEDSVIVAFRPGFVFRFK